MFREKSWTRSKKLEKRFLEQSLRKLIRYRESKINKQVTFKTRETISFYRKSLQWLSMLAKHFVSAERRGRVFRFEKKRKKCHSAGKKNKKGDSLVSLLLLQALKFGLVLEYALLLLRAQEICVNF